MPSSEWHFKRALIAEETLKAMYSGVILSTTVMAAPKTGLSHFFIHDLMPCATQQGYIVAYVNLANPLVPAAAAMLMALDRLATSSNQGSSSFGFFKGMFLPEKKKAPKGVDYYHSTLPGDEEYFQDDITPLLALIEQKVIKALQKGPLLLIFDGAHALSRDAHALRFAEHLKDLLLAHRDQIFPLYGTSDLEAWRLTFQNKAAPLYSEGASLHTLPLLDEAFVQALLDRHGLQIPLDEARQAFAQLGGCPGIFAHLVADWSATRDTGLLEYTARYSALQKPPTLRTAGAPCCS